MAACNCATVASLKRVGASLVRVSLSAWAAAGAANAPAMEALVPASALHFRKSLRATPAFFGWVEWLHNFSRNVSNLWRRYLLSAFIRDSLDVLEWGVVVERHPDRRHACDRQANRQMSKPGIVAE